MVFKMSYGALDTPAPRPAEKPVAAKKPAPRRRKTATLNDQAQALFDPRAATPAEDTPEPEAEHGNPDQAAS